MILNKHQRQMVWQWNKYSQPVRVILDFTKTRKTLLSDFLKESNMIEEFKSDPTALVEVIEDIDTRIGYEHSCYLDEKERGGLSEICSCGAGKQEFLNALEEGERLRNE